MLGIMIGIFILAFLLIVLIRALRFKPEEREILGEDRIEVNSTKIIDDMSAMIRCKTVSYREESLIDRQEFEKFNMLLKERFPLIHEKCTLSKIGKTGLLYHLKGKAEQNLLCAWLIMMWFPLRKHNGRNRLLRDW